MIKKIVIFLMLLSVAFVFAACGNEITPTGTSEPSVNTGSETTAVTSGDTKAESPEPPQNSAPLILAQPEDVSVAEGEPIRFSLTAGGNEVLHYEWTIEKDGSTDTFSVDAPELHLTDSAMVSQHDGAKVWCRVITEDGFVDSRKAAIRVTAKASDSPAMTDDHPSVRARDYEVPVLIGNLPRSDAMDGIWAILRGYWTAADNLFVRFDIQDGLPGIEYGIWEGGGSGFGEFAGADPMGEYTAALTIRFPATEASEVSDAHPETDVTVFIDLSGLDNDGKIRIKTDNHGSGDWYTYAYGGATSDAAYKSVH